MAEWDLGQRSSSRNECTTVYCTEVSCSSVHWWKYVIWDATGDSCECWVLDLEVVRRQSFVLESDFLFLFFWPAQPPQPLHILLLDYNPTRPLLKMFWHGVLRPGLLVVLKCANLNKPRLFLGPGFVRFRTGMRGGEFLSPVFILLW